MCMADQSVRAHLKLICLLFLFPVLLDPFNSLLLSSPHLHQEVDVETNIDRCILKCNSIFQIIPEPESDLWQQWCPSITNSLCDTGESHHFQHPLSCLKCCTLELGSSHWSFWVWPPIPRPEWSAKSQMKRTWNIRPFKWFKSKDIYTHWIWYHFGWACQI